MQKQVADGVVIMIEGYLRYSTVKGDGFIMFPCVSQEVFDVINSIDDAHEEYERYLKFAEQEQLKQRKQ